MTKRRTLSEKAWKFALAEEILGFSNPVVCSARGYLAGYRARRSKRK